jgi:hypothetical protein
MLEQVTNRIQQDALLKISDTTVFGQKNRKFYTFN